MMERKGSRLGFLFEEERVIGRRRSWEELKLGFVFSLMDIIIII